MPGLLAAACLAALPCALSLQQLVLLPGNALGLLLPQLATFSFFVFLEKYVSKFSLETSSQLLNHKHVPATKHRQSVHTFLHTFSAWRIALF